MIRFTATFLFIFLVNYGSAEEVFEITDQCHKVVQSDLYFQKQLDYYDSFYNSKVDSVKKGDSLLLELKNYAESKQNYEGVLKVLYRLGKSRHLWHKDDIEAVKYFFESLKYSQRLKNHEYTCKTYNFLGIIFYTNNKFDDALKYFEIALHTTWNDSGHFNSVPSYLSGLCQYELGRYSLAMIQFQTALKLANLTKNIERIQEIKLGIARVYVAEHQYSKAEDILKESIKYYKEESSPEALAIAYSLWSKVYFSKDKLKEALDYSLLAYHYSDRSTTLGRGKIQIVQLLHDIYRNMGNTKEAYKYLIQVQKLKDASTELNITSQIALTHAQYKNEIERSGLNATIVKQEADKKTAIMAAGILGGLFVVIGVLLIFVRKERQKSENLIHNILPAKTVQELKKFGKAIPNRHEAVSVMFCDVKEFSHLASTLEPENLISILDFYFSHFDRIIRSYHNIEKIKTIGDAYLCVSGLSSNDQHASDMVEAAYEIVQFVRASKEEVKEKFGQNIEFRVGIHSGSLVSGVVGTHKYAYDVWGETVNIAARLEGASEPGKINISQATYEAIQTKFSCEKRGIIEVKNGLKLEMYFVVSPA